MCLNISARLQDGYKTKFLISAKNNTKRGAFLMPASRIEAPEIALSVEDEQRRSPTCIIIHQGASRCLVSDWHLNFPDSNTSKPKRSKRLYVIVWLTMNVTDRCLTQSADANINKKTQTYSLFVYYCSFRVQIYFILLYLPSKIQSQGLWKLNFYLVKS